MTRQHFEAIAAALKANRPGENWDANKRVQWNLDARAMAQVAARFNSGFKPQRFYDACGGLFAE